MGATFDGASVNRKLVRIGSWYGYIATTTDLSTKSSIPSPPMPDSYFSSLILKQQIKGTNTGLVILYRLAMPRLLLV